MQAWSSTPEDSGQGLFPSPPRGESIRLLKSMDRFRKKLAVRIYFERISQKILVLRNEDFFIQAAGLAYHHDAVVDIINKGRLWSAFVVSHHAPACISLRLDDIQCFALMIYRRQAADDIHASRRDLLRNPIALPAILWYNENRKAA